MDSNQIRKAREIGALIEVCPSSNIICCGYSSITEHVFSKFREEGCKVTICTDDILLFKNTLSEEFELLVGGFKLGRDFCRRVCLDGLDGCFLREGDIREEIRSKIEQFFEKKE